MSRVLINIHSEQTMPNLIAIQEVNPDFVISLATNEYQRQVGLFQQYTNVPHEYRNISPYDIEYNFNKLSAIILEFDKDDEVIINYTGGTKMMVLSVVLKLMLSATQKLLFVYINTTDKYIELLDITEEKELKVNRKEIQKSIPIEAYIFLKNEKIDSFITEPSPNMIERFKLSEQLLINKKVISLFSKQKQFFNGKYLKHHFNIENSKYKMLWTTESLSVNIDDIEYKYNHADGGRYFSGAWLEEYVFLKLVKSKKFERVISSLKFKFTTPGLELNKNEIDVVVTNGIKTVFVECKAGDVSQDYVYKLKAIRDHFLGTYGIAVLLTKFQQKANIIEKCNDAGITLISEKEIENIDNIINNLIN